MVETRTRAAVLTWLRRACEPLMVRTLHLFWRFSRGLTLGARAVVINPAGEVLLIKHSYVDGWHLPGGGVETGETLLDALRRELREEANISLAAPPVLHAIYHNAHASVRDHVAVYVVTKYLQNEPPQPNREIIAHGFFAPDALPADTTAGTRRRIREALGGEAATAVW